MKPENRKQVRLILDIRREETEKRIADAVKALHADHAAKGCLRSGATIKKHGAIITVEGQNFIKDTLDEIADVSQEIDAYLMFCETFNIFTGTVGRAFSDNPVMDSLDRKISIDVKPTLLLASIIGQLEKQKELRRYSFLVPDREQRPAFASRTIGQEAKNSPAAAPLKPQNKTLPTLPQAKLERWWANRSEPQKAQPEKQIIAAVRTAFPDNHISRERIRALIGPRKRGPKPIRG